MVLRRLGNKAKIAGKIAEHLPPHKIYIEPFFGAGGMFFNKPNVPIICVRWGRYTTTVKLTN